MLGRPTKSADMRRNKKDEDISKRVTKTVSQRPSLCISLCM